LNYRGERQGIWGRLTRRKKTQVQRLEWTPELVGRFWAGFAQTRLTEYSFSRLGGKSLVLAIEHHLSTERTVLDYGAGDGELVGFLLERGYKVAAFEPSGSRNSHLVSRVAGRGGFLGLVGPDTKEQFDVVLLIEVIEHVLDQELDRVLWRVHGLLKDGGTLIVTTPNNEDLELGMAYCPVSGTLFHRWQHVRSFTAESLSTLLGRYGISPVVVHQVEFRADLFEPFDARWGGDRFMADSPSHLVALRADIPVRMGSEANLLFVGHKAQ
jgi:2-polyprenyl-3-methyl-5-hydroxy-6-metoxy-1,4-benzoquinol methylase